jgi:hypothetical protein
MLPRPENQPPGLYHLAIGDILVATVNDGTYQASFEMIVGIDPKECERNRERRLPRPAAAHDHEHVPASDRREACAD